jgi:hypothetical protein
MAKPSTTTQPAAQPSSTPTPTALAAAPTVAPYLAALAAAYGTPGKGPAYANASSIGVAPPPHMLLAIGPGCANGNPKAPASKTHARFGALLAALAAGQSVTVQQAGTAYGLPYGDITWALSPAHRGGAQLVPAPGQQ